MHWYSNLAEDFTKNVEGEEILIKREININSLAITPSTLEGLRIWENKDGLWVSWRENHANYNLNEMGSVKLFKGEELSNLKELKIVEEYDRDINKYTCTLAAVYKGKKEEEILGTVFVDDHVYQSGR